MAEGIGSFFVLTTGDILKRDVELKCCTGSEPVIDQMKQHLLEGNDGFYVNRLGRIISSNSHDKMN